MVNTGREMAAAESGASGLPSVSIVLSSYNYERYLRTAIRSALDQTYRHLEIIVVDDGSTDGSGEIVREFEGRILAIFQPNQGQTSAVNAGFAASTGDLVIFLDADDVLTPTVAEEVAAAWRPGAAKVQYGLAIIDGAGDPVGTVEPVFPRDYTPQKLAREFSRTNNYAWPPCSGNAFSRVFLRQVMPLPIERFPFAPDGILNTVAPLFGDVLTLDKPLGFYRVHGKNAWAMSGFSAARIDNYLTLRRREIDYLRELAAQRDAVLSPGDPQDYSLTFLRYRLVGLKLRSDRAAAVPPLGLCLLAARAIGQINLSAGHRAAELLWFVLVAVTSGGVARRLIEWRYIPSTRPAWLSRSIGRNRGNRAADTAE